MVYDFSNYLRNNDAIGNQQNILLSEELRHANLMLIMKNAISESIGSSDLIYKRK